MVESAHVGTAKASFGQGQHTEDVLLEDQLQPTSIKRPLSSFHISKFDCS